MKNVLLFTTFVLGNFTVLFLCFLLLTIKTSRQSSALDSAPLEVATGRQSYDLETPQVLGLAVSGEIIAGESAVELIENFFKKYRSPMVGLGHQIVDAAEKYQLPFGLLPAIGQCEGNLGKSIPAGSFNTWGFGIYGSQMTKFSSWEEAITTVSKTLRTDYFDLGLTTPETMMPKYAPPSDGSWARCVNTFLAELQ